MISTEGARAIIIHERRRAGAPKAKIVLRDPHRGNGKRVKSEPKRAPRGPRPPEIQFKARMINVEFVV